MESRDKMTINFEHMKPWKAAYADFRLVELNATKDSKEENILAMKSMRSGFEKMVSTLAEHAGITDEVVLQVKRQLNKNGDRVDLYGRILALCAYKVIDEQSGKNYNTIRILGNHGVHDNEEPYLSASPQQVKKDMEQMYKLLYEETYLFASEYIKKEPVLGKKNSKGKKAIAQNPAQGEKPEGSCLKSLVGFIVSTVILICAILFLSSYIDTQRQIDQTRQEIEKRQEQFWQDYDENKQRIEDIQQQIYEQQRQMFEN